MKADARSIVAVLLAGAVSAGAFELPAGMKQCTDRFVRHVIECDFDSAFHIADSLKRADAREPLGPLLRLLAHGMRDLDYDRQIDTAGFLEAHRVSVKRIREYENAHGKTSYTMTLAAFANATHAAYYLRQKRYFAAIGTGLDAVELLHEAKKADSTNYDVDFFLGLYDYAKAELRRHLWMILFWYGGSKAEGIERLKQCIAGARMAGPAAKLSLADIYIQEKDYGKARAVIDELLAAYPKSRFILWTHAKYLMAIERFDAAADVYGALSASYAASRRGEYNALATRRRQIETMCAAGNAPGAGRLAKKTLSGACRKKQWRDHEECAEIRKMLKRGKCGGEGR
ncbi:MAG: hypothetical protein GF418_00530 [Chitinivibrionales bacterium]|nr:hypothetical protein [Chitinivibrionales bacterium]